MEYQLILKGEDIRDLHKIIAALSVKEEPLKELRPEIQHVTMTDHVDFTEHPLEDAAKSNCKECGTEFKPLRKDSLFCSKKCYMKNYWKNYKKPANDKPLKQKLDEISKTCPPPRKRPEFMRDFQ